MHHSHQLQLFPSIIFPLHSGFHFPCWSCFLPPAHYLRQHLGRFHFHPLVYFFAYLSPALAVHQHAITRELRGSWGSCKRLRNMTDSLHVLLRCRHNNWCSGLCLCSPQSPSNLGNLTATRIGKSLASFQLPPILLPFFPFPPCWAPKALCAERKKKMNLQPRKKRQSDKEPFPPSLAPYGSTGKSTNWDSTKGNKQLYFIQLGWKTTERKNGCWGEVSFFQTLV